MKTTQRAGFESGLVKVQQRKSVSGFGNRASGLSSGAAFETAAAKALPQLRLPVSSRFSAATFSPASTSPSPSASRISNDAAGCPDVPVRGLSSASWSMRTM
jgi:hypothetical protein